MGDMSDMSPKSLIDAAQAAFGSPTSPRLSEPTVQQVKELGDAWKVAPQRYRESLGHYLLECVSRNPQRIESFLTHMPFLDWSFGRGLMPFWVEAIIGLPEGTVSRSAQKPYVAFDAQPQFWETFSRLRPGKVEAGLFNSAFDPFDANPSTLSGKRALCLSKAFIPFIQANMDRPEFRDDVINRALIPIADSQSALTSPPNDPMYNAMAGYLSAALSHAWIVDYVADRTPVWEDWMFAHSCAIWPNFGHLVNGKGSPPHMYGLPEVFLQRVLSKENRLAQSIVDMEQEHLDAIQMGVARALDARAGEDGNSVWLPSAKVMRTMAKDGSQLRSFLDNQIMKMEIGRLRKVLLNPQAQEQVLRPRPIM